MKKTEAYLSLILVLLIILLFSTVKLSYSLILLVGICVNSPVYFFARDSIISLITLIVNALLLGGLILIEAYVNINIDIIHGTVVLFIYTAILFILWCLICGKKKKNRG